MAVLYLFGFLLTFGFTLGNPVVGNTEPAYIEDLRSSSPSRIVAGWPAADGQFPHQISLRMINFEGSVSSCGGSIIHHEWVITAAHCVANRYSFVVRLGLTNLTRPEFIVETSRRYFHPNYAETSSRVQTDDIALIQLVHHIPYGPHIQPVRLQPSADKNRDYTGLVLTVSGYGLTLDGGSTSEVLNWVHLRGISLAECRYWYLGGTVQEQTLCAEYYNDTAQSSCQGDSGGPLIWEDEDGKPTMVGIVSFGSIAGCDSVYPSAYVRPGHYHEWIAEVSGIDFDWNRDDWDSKEDGCHGNGESEEDSEEEVQVVDRP